MRIVSGMTDVRNDIGQPKDVGSVDIFPVELAKIKRSKSQPDILFPK
jgi:hypothetical protein